MRVWVAFILCLTMAGCLKTTDQVDIGLLAPERDSKLYVICFISPQDTVLAAKVALSDPAVSITAEPSLLVETATVTIADEQTSVLLPYDNALGYYRLKPGNTFSIKAGQTYQLTVQLGEGRRVTAQATVPMAVPIQRVQRDSSITTTATGQSILYQTTIFWNAPGGVNYYRGYGEVRQSIVSQQGALLETRVSQPSFFVDREMSPGPAVRSLTGSYTLVVPLNARVRTSLSRIGLFTTDLNYYRYHETLREQINAPTNSFASSTVLFSNIVGGYGVFAAYNAVYVTL
ncbi:hypothetical protein GCM10027185_50760 [Spirosoma pulveris]